ncbi:MAG: manganese efflux pump [Lachnospiraceae bacterium]|nr:manganese efflux pump [Lachnospiraceae bacterium]
MPSIVYFEIILIGIGLSMDAFAVSVCKGLAMKRPDMGKAVMTGAYFGVFQAVMPILGWLLGTRFRVYIESVDHWVAFGLLFLIGGKMIWEAVREDPDEEKAEIVRAASRGEAGYSALAEHRELFILAIATSIDALAVGISFAAIGTPIFPSAEIIGLITFCLSVIGVYTGVMFGNRYERKAEIAGGIILMGIGVKILIEHMM